MKAYRYQDRLYSTGDEDYGYTTNMRVELIEFEIIKETPKGMWIAERFGAGGLSSRKRFVKKVATKHYACLSKEEAKESFLRRKQAQIKILQRQLMWAETAMNWFGRPEEQ